MNKPLSLWDAVHARFNVTRSLANPSIEIQLFIRSMANTLTQGSLVQCSPRLIAKGPSFKCKTNIQ